MPPAATVRGRVTGDGVALTLASTVASSNRLENSASLRVAKTPNVAQHNNATGIRVISTTRCLEMIVLNPVPPCDLLTDFRTCRLLSKNYLESRATKVV